METFEWESSLGTAKQSKARVLKTSYGDGYEQRTGDGLNPIERTYSVTVKASSLAMAASIETFLYDRGGSEAFAWTPPNASSAIAVTCEEWSRRDRLFSSVITATFVQDFRP